MLAELSEMALDVTVRRLPIPLVHSTKNLSHFFHKIIQASSWLSDGTQITESFHGRQPHKRKHAYLFPNAETRFDWHHNSFDFSRLSNKTKPKSEHDKDVPRKRRAAT
jgi:hypothetical protein